MRSGTSPAFSNSTPLWTSSVASPPSSTIRFGPIRRASQGLSVHHQYSSSVSPFQAKTGTPWGSSVPFGPTRRRGGVILGGEDVAASPANLGAEVDQRLDQDGGLDRHVQASP